MSRRWNGGLRFANPPYDRETQPPRLVAAGIEGATNMAFKNFKLETDTDGIALVTWDIPGRSMNVLDETSTTELEEILKQTTADAAVRASSSPPLRKRSARAPTFPCSRA